MSFQPKLTTEQWAAVRERWESDPRDGYAWVVTEMGLPVTDTAVRRRARTEKWAKASQEGGRKPLKDKGSRGSSAKAGRPSAYRQEYAEQAYRLCLMGLTDAQLADFFEVNESTINRWKLAEPEFRESLKKGKAVADARVAESLFLSATGYSHAHEDIRVVDGQIVITPTTKHYPPDTTAMIFWLKNRQPALWRDRVETDITVGTVDRTELRDRFERLMEEARARQERVLRERGLSGEDE